MRAKPFEVRGVRRGGTRGRLDFDGDDPAAELDHDVDFVLAGRVAQVVQAAAEPIDLGPELAGDEGLQETAGDRGVGREVVRCEPGDGEGERCVCVELFGSCGQAFQSIGLPRRGRLDDVGPLE